jgi:hypothetical protein
MYRGEHHQRGSAKHLVQDHDAVERLARELESTRKRVRRLETERGKDMAAIREETAQKMRDVVKFLLREVQNRVSQQPDDSLHTADVGLEAGGSQLVAQHLRREILEQQSAMASRITSETERAHNYADITMSKVQGEIDWFQKLLATRLDDQRRWFEQFQETFEAQQRDAMVGSQLASTSTQTGLESRLREVEEKMSILEECNIVQLIENASASMNSKLREEHRRRLDAAKLQDRECSELRAAMGKLRASNERSMGALQARIEDKIAALNRLMTARAAALSFDPRYNDASAAATAVADAGGGSARRAENDNTRPLPAGSASHTHELQAVVAACEGRLALLEEKQLEHEDVLAMAEVELNALREDMVCALAGAGTGVGATPVPVELRRAMEEQQLLLATVQDSVRLVQVEGAAESHVNNASSLALEARLEEHDNQIEGLQHVLHQLLSSLLPAAK